LVEHHLPVDSSNPDRNGATIIQDLGRSSGILSFKGVLTSTKEERQELLKKVKALQWFFNCKHPIYFSSDLVNQIEMSRAIIEYLRFSENTDSPYIIEFFCRLREYTDSVGQDQYSKLESKIHDRTKLWSEVEVLKITIRYRTKFISSNDKFTKTEIAKKIGDSVLIQGTSIKDNI
jgi:hypothetical protein